MTVRLGKKAGFGTLRHAPDMVFAWMKDNHLKERVNNENE